MAGPTLLNLPREIRQQIYVEALSSPTGYVWPMERTNCPQRSQIIPVALPTGRTFRSTPQRSGEDMRLSLLQTCRQVYAEAREVLFTHNTVVVWPIWQLLRAFRGLDASLRLRVRHIWLGADFTQPRRLKSTARALGTLAGWAQHGGTLRTLTLSLVGGIEDMADLMQLRAHAASEFQDYLDVLRASRRDDCQWGGVVRRLELRVASLREGRTQQPRELVRDLHRAFGGELWVDGRLCYLSGAELVPPFRRTGYGEWQIAWFQPDNAIIWGTSRSQIAVACGGDVGGVGGVGAAGAGERWDDDEGDGEADDGGDGEADNGEGDGEADDGDDGEADDGDDGEADNGGDDPGPRTGHDATPPLPQPHGRRAS